MTPVVDRAISLLHLAGVTLDHGLSDAELTEIQERFGFTFSPDHRELLAAVVPNGDGWTNWRSESPEGIVSQLEWPTDGTIFDVRMSGFWPLSWGSKPRDPVDIEATARLRMAAVPRLVPLYSHRYLPAAPAPRGSPVFSVYQTDVIYYGDDLADYIAREFKVAESTPNRRPTVRINFWSDLAEGAESEDL